MEKQKFSQDEMLAKDDVAKILEDLASGLRTGCVTLAGADNALSLLPSEEVSFSMDASQGKGKGKVKISFKWKTNEKSFATDIPSVGDETSEVQN